MSRPANRAGGDSIVPVLPSNTYGDHHDGASTISVVGRRGVLGRRRLQRKQRRVDAGESGQRRIGVGGVTDGYRPRYRPRLDRCASYVDHAGNLTGTGAIADLDVVIGDGNHHSAAYWDRQGRAAEDRATSHRSARWLDL